MLLILSACVFALALAVFVYLFDRYMGASDTGEIADSMSQIRDQTGRKDPAKRSRAATGN
ncbi:MAG TPA: hypothetical protein VJR04_01125 [Terriglobales bacterium]|nr:hypothetical protein [Terriglobales bacterium]